MSQRQEALGKAPPTDHDGEAPGLLSVTSRGTGPQVAPLAWLCPHGGDALSVHGACREQGPSTCSPLCSSVSGTTYLPPCHCLPGDALSSLSSNCLTTENVQQLPTPSVGNSDHLVWHSRPCSVGNLLSPGPDPDGISSVMGAWESSVKTEREKPGSWFLRSGHWQCPARPRASPGTLLRKEAGGRGSTGRLSLRRHRDLSLNVSFYGIQKYKQGEPKARRCK